MVKPLLMHLVSAYYYTANLNSNVKVLDIVRIGGPFLYRLA